MRYQLPLFLFVFLSGLNLSGQNRDVTLEGTVTYITTQNVYVKFTSTSQIKAGDTLFVRLGETLVPAVIVKDLSSTSCVCTPFESITLKVNDKVNFKSPKVPSAINEMTAPSMVSSEPANPPAAVAKPDTARSGKTNGIKRKQQIHGFVNVASYSNFSTFSSGNSQQEKLTFSLTARNLGNSNLSAECYISYYLNDKQINETSNSIFNDLKIYNLAFSYDFGKRATLSLGRKMNPKLSNMGSNDGLQFELKFKPVSIGIIAGFRPNYTDYGFSSSLFQAGAYLFNEVAGKKGFMQTTLAFINQTNSGKTDRRFFYLQHVNSLVKNLTFYGSAEMDIYGKTIIGSDSTYNSTDSTFNVFSLYKTNSNPKLTNLYVSLSYRILRCLGISFSYSNRQNVIYYETYKSYLDRLLDLQVMHGYSFQANYTPVNNLSFGATAAYRFEQRDPRPTQNLYAYLTYSQIPGIKTSMTVSTILMNTAYLKGRIYSAGLSKDLASGKLYLGLTYRYLDYHYNNTEILPTYQNMGEFSISWRIIRKLLLSVYYEGTFEKADTFHRIYAQINMGF
jgi:hypothetical protein